LGFNKIDTAIDQLKDTLEQGRVVVLDGAMGTELQRHGVKTELPLWSAAANLSHGELVKEIHLEYLRAGAQIITTNTFRTGPRPVKAAGISTSYQELTAMACEHAQAARLEYGNRSCLIAGCVATLEDCYEPDRTPAEPELREEHLELISALRSGGVDFIFAETMNSIKETLVVLEAAQKVGLPVAVSFVCNAKGELLSGESLSAALAAVARFSPLYIGTNCAPPDRLAQSLNILTELSEQPVCVYANGMGHPGEPLGWVFGELGTEADQYLDHVKHWVDKGARIIGGCCGTTPEYIAKIAQFCGK
jgi:homocysteine S-methyltransferase